MKKRIIAALTALVMVVTMIPANAFAAETDPVQDVIRDIMRATGTTTAEDADVNVAYTQETLDALDNAMVKYENLPGGVQNVENVKNVRNLYAAIRGMKEYCTEIEAYKAAVNSLKGKMLVDVSGIKFDNDEWKTATVTAINNLKNADKVDLKSKDCITSDGRFLTSAEAGKDPEKPVAFAKEIKIQDISARYDATTKVNAPLDLTKLKSKYMTKELKDGKGAAYNLDRSKEDALVELFAGAKVEDATADTADKNFVDAIAAINAIDGADIDTIDESTIGNIGANTALKALVAVYGVDFIPGGNDDVVFKANENMKVADYVDYANAEKVALLSKALDKVTPLVGEKAAIVNATKSLTEVKVGDKTINYSEKQDLSQSNVKYANVNAVNIETVKNAYKAAKTVADKYAETKFKTELDLLNDALAKMVDPDDALNPDKTVGRVELAIEYKATIDRVAKKIENKETLTTQDKLDIDTIVKDTKVGAYLDKLLFDSEGAAGERRVAILLAEVKNHTDKVSAKPTDVAKAHAPAIKAALEAVPTYDNVAADIAKARKAAEEAIKLLNEYIKEMSVANATGDVVNDKNEISELSGEANNWSLTKKVDAYLANEGVKNSLIEKLEKTGKEILTKEAAVKDATYTGAATALKDAADKKSVNTYDERVAVNQAVVDFEKAYNKLTATQKVVFDADKKTPTNNYNVPELYKSLAKVKNMIARFDAIDSVKPVLDKLVKDKINFLVIEKDLLEPGKTIDYAANKVLLDAIDSVLKDENTKYIFEHLNKNVNGAYCSLEADPVANKDNLLYKDAIARYNSAKAEYNANVGLAGAKGVIAKIDALETLKADAKYADIDVAIKAYNEVEEAFNALSVSEKAQVTNQSKLSTYKADIQKAIVREIEAEIKTLATVEDNADKLTPSQIEKTKSIRANLEKYKEVLGTDIYDPAGAHATAMFKSPFNATLASNAFNALKKLNAAEVADANKEIAEVYKAISAGVAVVSAGNKTIDNHGEAKVVLDAIKAYNGLSDLAKKILVGEVAGLDGSLTKLSLYDINKTIAAEKEAKAFFLENATVKAIADQVATGEYIKPEVVLTDVNGKVIPADEYTVEYTNNLEIGVAKFVATAKTTSAFAGSIEGEFNIVAPEAVEPVVPTGLKVVGTDHGIIKVAVDKVDVEGLTYKFFVKRVDAKDWVASKETASNEMVFRGLKKNHKYEVKAVTIVNNKASEEAVMDGTVWTNRKGNKSSFMYKPVINKVTINKGVAKVTVKAFNYNNIKYALGYKKAGASKYTWLQYTTRTVKTVKNLKKGVKYSFKVKYKYISEVSGTTVLSTKWSAAVTKVAR